MPHALTNDPDRRGRCESETKLPVSMNHPTIGHICGLEGLQTEAVLAGNGLNRMTSSVGPRPLEHRSLRGAVSD